MCELRVLYCIAVNGLWRISNVNQEGVILERCQIHAAVDEQDGKVDKRTAALNLECCDLLRVALDE